MPSVVTKGDSPSTAMQKPLTRPAISAVPNPARIDITRISPGTLATTVLPSAARCTHSEAPGMPRVDRPDMTMDGIMAEKHITEPTERAQPAGIATEVRPPGATAMNAEDHATGCKLPSA